MSFDIGSGHKLRWQDARVPTTDKGALDLGWLHPCTDIVEALPGDHWMHVDVTSGKYHSITAGGPGDEEHLTLQGSLLCPMCKTHGFVENGKWRSV